MGIKSYKNIYKYMLYQFPPPVHHHNINHNVHRILIPDFENNEEDLDILQQYAEHNPSVVEENRFIEHHPYHL